jgi:hypothetical protein
MLTIDWHQVYKTRVARARSNEIRRYILEQLETHPGGIARQVAGEYGISRQAVNRHLQELASEGQIRGSGATRAKVWEIAPPRGTTRQLRITPVITEDRVWSEYGRPLVQGTSPGVHAISQFGLTAAVANVIDHAGATRVTIAAARDGASVRFSVTDDGAGIFRTLIDAFGFEDEHHALFELSKGRLTTNPAGHAGAAVFLSLRMFDSFEIRSGRGHFIYDGNAGTWRSETAPADIRGTSMAMRIRLSSDRSMQDVIDWYMEASDPSLDGKAGERLARMHVHAALLQRDGDALVTRDQARRLLNRVETCREALIDFRGVKTIGPAFADEVFRVFRTQFPDTTIVTLNAGPGVRTRIHETLAAARTPVSSPGRSFS